MWWPKAALGAGVLITLIGGCHSKLTSLRNGRPNIRTLIIATGIAIGTMGHAVGVGGQIAERSVELREQARFGSISGGPTALSSIGHLVVSRRTGAIFITQAGSEVRVFDKAGRHLRTIGSRGRGPGEFESIGALSWTGDLLFVFDPYLRRISYFTEDGELVDVRLLDSPTIAGHRGQILALGTAADGLIGVIGVAAENALLGGVQWEPLVRMNESGGYHILDRLDIRDVYGMFDGSTGRVFFVRPVHVRSLYAFSPSGSTIVAVHQSQPINGSQSWFRVRRLSGSGDVIYARSYRYRPRSLSSTTLHSELDRRARVWATRHGAREGDIRSAFRPPDYEPPVSSVVAGVDGSVWLRREMRGSDAVWWVLDPKGDIIGEVRLPDETRVLHVDGQTIWVTASDELGVPYAIEYVMR